MEKSNIIKLFKEEYSLSLNSKKWISKGGEILNYIGQNVLLVDFRKESEDSGWTTTQELVSVIGISGYDEMTGTYLIAYNKEGVSEAVTERIGPEGFSFNIPERDLWMHRFLPFSLHIQMTERELTYKRYGELFRTKPSMSLNEIRAYCRGKQKETVGYKNYIALITDTDVEGGLGVGITQFRIKQFTMPVGNQSVTTVGIKDQKDNLIMARIKTDTDTEAFDLSINGTYIGKAKFIDIQG